MAQDTSIQFASLDSLTADMADAKTRFSLLSIESTYGTQSLRGGALCLVGQDPNLQFPRTFCFYFEEGEPPLRDNDKGYDAGDVGPLSLGDVETELSDWRGEMSLSSLPDSVVNLIDSKISDAEDEVLSVRDILKSEGNARVGEVKLGSLSSNLTPGTDDAEFGSFDGIMQAAHTIGAMMPRLRDAQSILNVDRKSEETKGSSGEANRADSSRRASSIGWWFVPGLLGFILGGLLLYVGQIYFVQGNGEQQLQSTRRDEEYDSNTRRYSGPESSGEEGADGKALQGQIDQLEDSLGTVAETGQALRKERKSLKDERKALANERLDLSDEREALTKELSTLIERLERGSKIDKNLNERLQKKEALYGGDTVQLMEDLLDLHETVLDTFGIESANPEDAEEEVRNLKAAMEKLWIAVDGIDGHQSKTLIEIVEKASEKSSNAIRKVKKVRKWAANTLRQGGDQTEDPIAQYRDHLRRVMEAASNGEEISTLGALRRKVESLREDASRASELEEEVSSLEQSLSSVREDKDALKQKVGNLERKAESLEQKNGEIVECLHLICDKISFDPIDKSGERWAENFRRRLEDYTDNDWQALLGISASLLAFDEAKSATENNDALLDELDINDLENKLKLFTTNLDRSGIQEMIPNAFSDGWLHSLFRAKAVIDAYFMDEHPEVKDAIDQAEAVMRTLLHRIDGDYHMISLPASLEQQALPGGEPDTDRGSSILEYPGIKDRVKEVYEEKGGRIAYDVGVFPHYYDESGFKHATVYVPSPSWLTS